MNLSKRKQTQEHVLYHSTYINAKGWQNHSVMIEISRVVALGKSQDSDWTESGLFGCCHTLFSDPGDCYIDRFLL